jgi:hypothetical protein
VAGYFLGFQEWKLSGTNPVFTHHDFAETDLLNLKTLQQKIANTFLYIYRWMKKYTVTVGHRVRATHKLLAESNGAMLLPNIKQLLLSDSKIEEEKWEEAFSKEQLTFVRDVSLTSVVGDALRSIFAGLSGTRQPGQQGGTTKFKSRRSFNAAFAARLREELGADEAARVLAQLAEHHKARTGKTPRGFGL